MKLGGDLSPGRPAAYERMLQYTFKRQSAPLKMLANMRMGLDRTALVRS